MNFTMNSGDTNFIGAVNAEKYHSFVDGNWRLDSFLQHFSKEIKKGNPLVYLMTDERIEHSWKVEVQLYRKQNCHVLFCSQGSEKSQLVTNYFTKFLTVFAMLARH